MSNKRKLQDLTIKDNFMFAAVMMEQENCRRFLEMALGVPIEHVEAVNEKSIFYHPEYKGIRLDVYAKDGNGTHFDVEMQVAYQHPGKRSRYYHSQMDVELLLAGTSYELLPDGYVIFVCDYDPFGLRKYRYSFDMVCREDGKLELQDGNHSIFLSTSGANEADVSEELVKFLKYVKADLQKSTEDFEDDYVAQIQRTVEKIKTSREMGGKFMLFEELLNEERKKGMEKGVQAFRENVLEFLEEIGDVPDQLREQVMIQKNMDVLKTWSKTAARAKSVEEFMQKM